MVIERYGIRLHKMRDEDCEMVRIWRNDPKISQHMFFRSHITADMQVEWFHSINNFKNYFFIIEVSGKKIGLINISSIDWENKTAFSGLFVYDDSYWGTDVPARASLALLDVFMLLLGIEKIYAKVRGNNEVAHRYNSALGFLKTKQIEFGQGFEYELTQKRYVEASSSLKNSCLKIFGKATVIKFLSESSETFLTGKILRSNSFAEMNLSFEKGS